VISTASQQSPKTCLMARAVLPHGEVVPLWTLPNLLAVWIRFSGPNISIRTINDRAVVPSMCGNDGHATVRSERSTSG
jgi:hypothetical protein